MMITAYQYYSDLDEYIVSKRSNVKFKVSDCSYDSSELVKFYSKDFSDITLNCESQFQVLRKVENMFIKNILKDHTFDREVTYF